MLFYRTDKNRIKYILYVIIYNQKRFIDIFLIVIGDVLLGYTH